MRFPPVKALTNIVSKATNSNLNLAVQEAPKYLTTFKDDVVYKKMNDINKWYTKIIGLDEVKLYQDRVFDLQQKLLNAQDKRREISLLLTEIRNKSNELQDQIHKVKRQDDLQKFLDLMKDETEVLKQEKHVVEMFSNSDREEREIFAAFTNAIRDSHEKQRLQLEYTKYFGLILSITGSFLAFMYSTLKKNDLKYFIEEKLTEIAAAPDQYKANNLNEFIENKIKGIAVDLKSLGLSKSLLANIQESQIKSENVMNTILHNHQQLMNVINKQTAPPPKSLAVLEEQVYLPTVSKLNEMPDGEKLLWFSVLSLVGLMILKKLFN
ncbi:hypothetical protein AMK59_7242 [Oryctes borbonicus]|uniref:Coiled-coil domain-containing protein 51 n=1 Tax=Oryctes borbonicus TaxID=1629725 RepID=A0A0T6AZF7_9SCAR|nr:hypothetical protein AMK59_7242 [Oryctes borbonicus]